MLMILCSQLNLSAQITLHEATDVTQTKATLSADFPDLNSEHGFQYKYGTLPEIDDFSKVALSSISDPVQINTTGNAWSARTVKGWVESKSDLSVGQTSVMSANVNFSEPTTVTFEWSVDSEESIGILSFIVDGKTVSKISGAVAFTEVSYQATAGKHTLQWQYKKTATTNIGLDLGMVRNINLQNTTVGAWISTTTPYSKIKVDNLYPNQSYIFRAFGSGSNVSSLKSFSTEPISVEGTKVLSTTQTTATVQTQFVSGDANVKTGYNIYSQKNLAPALSALLSYNSDVVQLQYISDQLKIGTNSLYGHFNSSSFDGDIDILGVCFRLKQRTEITFYYKNNGDSYVSGFFKINGNKQSISRSESSSRYSIWLAPGEYTLTWGIGYKYTTRNYSCDFSISSLCVKNVDLTDERLIKIVGTQYTNDNSGTKTMSDLKPNSLYYTQFFVEPNFDSPLENKWVEVKGEIIPLTTLPPYCSTIEATNITQTLATISGSFDKGDAEIESSGLQYKQATSNRWIVFQNDSLTEIQTVNLSRLRPDNQYVFRSYIKVASCDTIYSHSQQFRTLPVKAIKPILKDVGTHTATIEGHITYGDADIYQCGIQFKPSEKTEWTDCESNDADSVFVIIRENLDLYTSYQARTYVQSPGSDIQYSESLIFRTLHYVKEELPHITTTQTKAHFDILLNYPQDLTGGGVFIGTERNFSSDWVRIEAPINHNIIPITIDDLISNTTYYYRPFVMLGDEMFFFDGFDDNAYFITKNIGVNVFFSDISQTKANMKVEVNSGDALISDLRYRIGYGEMTQCQENNLLTNLVPGQTYSVTIYANVNGKEMTWSANTSDVPFKFTTKSVSTNINISETYQTAAKISWTSNVGDATMICSGLEFLSENITSESESGEHLITELIPSKSYSCRSYVETVEGGRIYSTQKYFTTNSITANTLPVSNISNRSATLNGTIDCDTYSSAEFGFQWKQMEGWASEPAFTKGRKLDDGTISVALVNGMLEPNTDYQYRTAVRYQDKIYYAPSWVTFRTESEFIYYPASVYTMFRTDRENNALVLCGYYVAGSESIVSQGYEYWQTGNSYIQARASQSPVIINTDASMQHEFALGELPNGSYNVRAFVKTESGATIYGTTLGFTSSANGYSGVDNIESELPYIIAEGGVVKVYNANQLQCVICSVNGQILANKMIIDSYDEFRLTLGNFVIVNLSNGLRTKIKI